MKDVTFEKSGDCGSIMTRRGFIQAAAAAIPAIATYGVMSARAGSVDSSALRLEFSENGSIEAAHFRGLKRPIYGETRFTGCQIIGRPVVHRTEATVSVFRDIENGKHSAHVVERFVPNAHGVRWDVEVTGTGEPWTAPIQFFLRYPSTSDLRFWTAWANPYSPVKIEAVSAGAGSHAPQGTDEETEWNDPLTLMPLQNRRFYYGAPSFDSSNPRPGFTPAEPDLFSIPIATFSEPARDAGLTMACMLDDTLLDLTLDTAEDGSIVFSHLFHRICNNAPVRLSVQLLAHESGWRGGLRYLATEYPSYFSPVSQRAEALGGTAAYASSKTKVGEFDPEKMKAMAFRTNWMSSFDFPYMGLFLPPVADDVPWQRYTRSWNGGGQIANSNKEGPDEGGTTSIQELARYCKQMHDIGFHVLNYFNVTEFGARMQTELPAAITGNREGDWANPGRFLVDHFPKAMLMNRDATPYYSWGGAVAMNPGDPAYQDYLLQQARRHLQSFPDSDGFCIDRLDWLRFYDRNRDDAVSWFDDAAAESLIISWHEIISKLAPEVHNAGKVLFCNNHTKRIDVLNQIDGIYDEFAYFPTSLNVTSLLGIHRPVLGWTKNSSNLRPDPDLYFQRNLYLGVFPTAPFPNNDHAITPDPWVDQQYLAYGPLLDAMRGKRWVLSPHAISVVAGTARANLFETAHGLVAPVMLGGTDEQAVVQLGNVRVHSAEVMHPGSLTWISLTPSVVDPDRVQVTVPLIRGCAMLRLL